MEKCVYAKKIIISMDLFVCFVLMDNNGIKPKKNVNALKDRIGMEIFVKKLEFVLDLEFGMNFINNAFVQINIFGMDLFVWNSHNVVVGNFGIQPL